ncbi:MAG: sigma 54-interacting transcriptional regulator [Bryobacteraceae bacterium]
MLERTVTAHRVEDDIVGHSPVFVNVLNQVGIIAKSDSVTLIQGETGTGKEVIARAIHDQSLRSRGPFVKLKMSHLGLLKVARSV